MTLSSFSHTAPPPFASPDWETFWAQELTWTYPDLYEVNARLFFEKARGYLKLSPSDCVLNIGCGPGYLEKFLSPHVSLVDAIDISDSMLERCRYTNLDNLKIRTAKLQEPYTDIALFPRQSYSLFLCIGVLQYYRSWKEITALIQSVKAVALPGARLILADLPQKRNLWQDMTDFSHSLFQGFRHRYGALMFQRLTANWNRFLRYRLQSKISPHLYFSPSALEHFCSSRQLKYQWIRENLSICPNRLNLMVYV